MMERTVIWHISLRQATLPGQVFRSFTSEVSHSGYMLDPVSSFISHTKLTDQGVTEPQTSQGYKVPDKTQNRAGNTSQKHANHGTTYSSLKTVHTHGEIQKAEQT